MLDDESGTIRTVAWSEICPWLSIFRCFRLAVSFRVMLFSAVAILLTVMGWGGFGWLLSGEPDDPEAVQWMELYRECPWQTITAAVPDQPAWPGAPMITPATTQPKTCDPFFGAWTQLSQPLWGAFFGPKRTVDGVVCFLLCGLWAVVIWAFFGGAITRTAAVQLTCDERIGWAAAIRYAFRKWPAYFAAPLFPLLGIVIVTVLVGLCGWLLNFNVGVLLAALVWPLLLLAGLMMAVLLLGLIFGWPLMWATISTEGTDSFDALSRTYSYTFGRPLHYLFYAIVAALLGALGWLLVSNFAAGVVGLTYWAASWWCGMDDIQLVIAGSDQLGPVGGFGAALIRFWAGCVKLLAVGFFYGYFWVAATAIYLLLRHDVDATEMDEIFLDEDASEETHGLPPLESDEAGTPMVADEVPEIEPDEPDAEPQENA